jgi:O-antigen ligase
VVLLGVATPVVGWRRVPRRRACAVAAVVALPGLVWVAAMSGAYERPTTPGMSGVDSAASGRGTLVRRSLDLWRTAPVLGVGPGNSVAAERELGLPQIGPWPIVVHNYGLQVLSETGAVGAAALAGTAGAVAVSMRRRWRALVVPAALLVPSALLDHVLWTFGFAMVAMAIALGTAQEERGRPRSATSASSLAR